MVATATAARTLPATVPTDVSAARGATRPLFVTPPRGGRVPQAASEISRATRARSAGVGEEITREVSERFESHRPRIGARDARGVAEAATRSPRARSAHLSRGNLAAFLFRNAATSDARAVAITPPGARVIASVISREVLHATTALGRARRGCQRGASTDAARVVRCCSLRPATKSEHKKTPSQRPENETSSNGHLSAFTTRKTHRSRATRGLPGLPRRRRSSIYTSTPPPTERSARRPPPPR